MPKIVFPVGPKVHVCRATGEHSPQLRTRPSPASFHISCLCASHMSAPLVSIYSTEPVRPLSVPKRLCKDIARGFFFQVVIHETSRKQTRYLIGSPKHYVMLGCAECKSWFSNLDPCPRYLSSPVNEL